MTTIDTPVSGTDETLTRRGLRHALDKTTDLAERELRVELLLEVVDVERRHGFDRRSQNFDSAGGVILLDFIENAGRVLAVGTGRHDDSDDSGLSCPLAEPGELVFSDLHGQIRCLSRNWLLGSGKKRKKQQGCEESKHTITVSHNFSFSLFSVD